ncbi:MAG: phosphodiester glycosidase family protein [Oscillospiraceae bacterium]|nr:phosphodiester glycosidase family protein [Oscillospiraceae bacterium]
MKHSQTKRMLTVLLVFMMVVGLVPMTAMATGTDGFVSETHDVFSSTESTIAPGVTQSINYAYANDGKQMVYYVLTADVTRDDVLVQTSYKDQYVNQQFGMEKLTAQIAYADALYTDETSDRFISEYYKVVGGVNASFYNMTTGQPSGITYLDGVQIGESASYNQFFAILADGTAIIDYTSNLSAYEGKIDQAVAGSQMIVWNGADITADINGSYNVDRHSRTCVGVTADGKVVMMSLDGRQEPFSCGGTMHELAQIMLEQGCVAAINLDGGGSTTFAARQEGENDVTIVNRPSDGSERSISSGLIIASLTVPSDTFDRATLTAEHEYVTPGSTVAVSAKGVSPAGTAAEIPTDISWQMKDASMGTVSDGVFTSNGTAGDAVVQMVYNGNVVGETTVHVVVPEALAFNSASITVPYGKSVEIGVTATYGLNEVVLKDGDVTFDLADDTIGTINGFTFTAGAEGSAAEVSAITATLQYDESVTASAEVKLGKGSEVVFDFEDGTAQGITFTEPAGEKYNYVWPESDQRVVTADTGKVHSGNYALAAHVNYSNSLESGYQKTSLVGGGDMVFENATRVGMWIFIPDEAVGLWARWTIHGAKTQNADGTYTWASITGQNMDTTAGGTGVVSQFKESGWHYLSIDTSEYAAVKLPSAAMMQFYVSDRDGSAYNYDASDYSNIIGNFTFYIDDITVDYSEAVDDREAPVFSSVVYADEFTNDAPELNGQTTSSSVLSFTATVADYAKSNSTGLNATTAKAYIDGVEVPFTYSNGKIAVVDAELADGKHTVKFSVCDNMGNYGYVIRGINVNAGSELPTVKLVAHDETLDRILHGSVYYMDLVASNVEKVEKVSVTIDLDSLSTWELEHMEVSDGFEAEYSIYAEENIATITVTRTGIADAEGEAVLVSIPVRVWQLKAGYTYPNGTKQGAAAYTSKQFRDMKEFWRISLIAVVDSGVLTCADGSVVTFTGERVFVDTEMWAEDADMIATDAGLAYYNSWNGGHVHTAEAVADKAASCGEDGYTGRTYCEVCSSVVEWGTTVPATGHTYVLTDGVLKCACGELLNGEQDGKLYVEGVVAAGWIGDSYYVEGVKLTGIQKVDGYYYDFGETGVCAGQTKYTGLFEDNGNTYYVLFGEMVTGWRMLTDGWYYFDETTGAGLSGEHVINVSGVNVTYTFESNGKLTSDVWYTNASNQKYRYYGPGYYSRVWKEIDGETYFLNWVGVAARGVYGVQDSPHMPEIFYLFDLDTCALVGVCDGFMTYGGNTYYFHTYGSNAPAYGFKCIDGYYYYFSTSTGAMRTGDYTVMSYASNGLLTENRTFHFDETHGYAVDADGNPLTTLETQEPESDYPKFVEIGGKTYYYRNANGIAFGFWQIDGYYYYFSTSTGEMRTGDYTVAHYASNGMLTEARTFHFDETHGYAVDANGNPLTTLETQEPEAEYPKFVEKNGNTYYYRNANGIAFGFWQIDGYYYYFSTSTGAMRTGDYTVVSYTSNGLLTENRTFHFDETHGYAVDADGNPLTTLETQEPEAEYPKFVEKNGNTYYYRSENGIAFGFWQIDGYYYYFSTSTGAMRTGDYTVLSYASNGLLDTHTTFHFDETYGYAVDANGDPITSLN